MDRKRIVVALAAGAALSIYAAQSTLAQPPGHGPNGGPRPHHNGPFIRPARERWRQMSPEDRQRLRSNAERWLSMPPEEQRVLRDRELMRRQRIQREADAALKQSGLQLEAEKREAYERRYLQERRRVEQSLRQDMEDRRQRELAPVLERLNREFQEPQKGGAGTPGTSTGSGSPTTPAPNK
jgi:hypothetical protein